VSREVIGRYRFEEALNIGAEFRAIRGRSEDVSVALRPREQRRHSISLNCSFQSDLICRRELGEAVVQGQGENLR
jgi:hypothetical protein